MKFANDGVTPVQGDSVSLEAFNQLLAGYGEQRRRLASDVHSQADAWIKVYEACAKFVPGFSESYRFLCAQDKVIETIKSLANPPCAKPEAGSSTYEALGFEALPTIRLAKKDADNLKQQAQKAGLILQAYVRELLAEKLELVPDDEIRNTATSWMVARSHATQEQEHWQPQDIVDAFIAGVNEKFLT